MNTKKLFYVIKYEDETGMTFIDHSHEDLDGAKACAEILSKRDFIKSVTITKVVETRHEEVVFPVPEPELDSEDDIDPDEDCEEDRHLPDEMPQDDFDEWWDEEYEDEDNGNVTCELTKDEIGLILSGFYADADHRTYPFTDEEYEKMKTLLGKLGLLEDLRWITGRKE